MKIGIGIDTGGTYTDAVVYDFNNKTILGVGKSLTTKSDLSVGILEALDSLPPNLAQKAELISLSTTLATNACLEGKEGSAKLIYFGGNPKVINAYGKKYGLPQVKDICIQESYTKFTGEMEREPDWDLFRENIKNGFDELDGVGIVEMNAMKNGAFVEKKAKEIFNEKYDIPVVCGHELFSKLNSLQRASSTLLNAKLFPVIKEFLDGITIALTKRNINAEVVIIRSDGSIMSAEFASVRPVETLLCGPAASVIGGTQLTEDENSIIIDMGGTTTDIALVKNHVPVTVVDGVSIGKWKTFVNGLYVKTFGLGGDSAIHYDDKKIFLENYRVVPLCVAAAKHPEIVESLKELNNSEQKHSLYLHEHYMLVKDINGNSRFTADEKLFCEALKKRPLILTEAAKFLNKDIYSFDISRLLKNGIVQVVGLTPTDIMHIKKDFIRYSTEASILGAQFVASNLGLTIKELGNLVYDEIKRKLYINIVKVMLENQNPHYMENGVSEDLERFINDSYIMAKSNLKDKFISTLFTTDFSLVGIGAPTSIFLDDVAKMLQTKAVIPKYYEVANALGAIVGNVYASYSVEIKPDYDPSGISGYIVYGNKANKFFEEIEKAEIFAISEAESGAKREATKRGALGQITLTSKLYKREAPGRDCTVYLGTSAIAQAYGTIAI